MLVERDGRVSSVHAQNHPSYLLLVCVVLLGLAGLDLVAFPYSVVFEQTETQTTFLVRAPTGLSRWESMTST